MSLPEGADDHKITNLQRQKVPGSHKPREGDPGGRGGVVCFKERGTGMGSTWDQGRGRPESSFYS